MPKNNTLTLVLIFVFLFAIIGLSIYHKKSNSVVASYTRTLNSTKKFKRESISKFEIHGIDVSHHQGNINWNKVKHPDSSKNIDFVFIRATVGTKKDRKFKKNWEHAKKHNFSVGAYHYYWSNVSSSVQANLFIKNVKLEEGDFPPVLDIEKTSTIQSLTNLRKGLKNWINLIETHYKVKPIIYTGDIFFKDYLKTDPYFRDYPRLWIANYNNVNSPKSNWHFWQYSDRAKVSGINELVDVNVFYGDSLNLNSLKHK